MSDSGELLVLRLALSGVLFAFLFAAALVLRSSLRPVRRTATAARVGASARLVVTAPARSGLEVGAEFQLVGNTLVGREVTNGIVLSDASVSGEHATLERTGRGWLVRDAGSTNGTYLANRRIDGRGVLLRHGDVVSFGVVGLRFEGR